jgi:hypothetical protein
MNPVHTFPPYSPKIHSDIIFPFTPRSSEWSLVIRFSDVDVEGRIILRWILRKYWTGFG